ncbi:extracellular matrix regulator RemB [Defluviitalea saccharophila]|uniref:DUF370 domain-containing protein n=1 Tax=Defluviitalea saccharophila TaxID=879970 RepID=A0ABZ2Y4R3_9FIRM
MFVHIGADVEIMIRDLIGIFDMKSVEESKITMEFLKVAQEEGFVSIVSKDDIKTMIITEEKGRSVVYLSPISSATLQKRINLISDLSIINK